VLLVENWNSIVVKAPLALTIAEQVAVVPVPEVTAVDILAVGAAAKVAKLRPVEVDVPIEFVATKRK
jgi:hypothetical protein